MGTFRLWSDEIEAMRPEARAAIEAGRTTMMLDAKAPPGLPVSERIDLRGLPPCFVSVGTCDHLLDDSLLFAARAAAAGVNVDLFVAPEMTHAFQMFDCGITRAWSAAQTAWIDAHLG